MTILKSILLFSFCLSSTSYAGHGREGGDPAKIKIIIDQTEYNARINGIRTMIESGALKNRLIYLLEERISDEILNGYGIQKNKLIKGIQQSKYNIVGSNSKCIDSQGVEKFASTEMNIFAADICIDLSKAYQNDHLVTYTEVIATLFHEHVHHFGLEDKNHKIGADWASKGTDLPMNFIYDSCEANLANNQESFSYRVYTDNYTLEPVNYDDSSWFLRDFKHRAGKAIENVYRYSGCNMKKFNLKIGCYKPPSMNGVFTPSSHVCHGELNEGFVTVIEDAQSRMIVNFMNAE